MSSRKFVSFESLAVLKELELLKAFELSRSMDGSGRDPEAGRSLREPTERLTAMGAAGAMTAESLGDASSLVYRLVSQLSEGGYAVHDEKGARTVGTARIRTLMDFGYYPYYVLMVAPDGPGITLHLVRFGARIHEGLYSRALDLDTVDRWRERMENLNRALALHGREGPAFETRSEPGDPVPLATMVKKR